MYQPKDIYGRPYPLNDCKAEVGKGWHPLIEECYELCVKNKVDISQVKEKFGTLRFYTFGSTTEVYDKIEDICARSANICENCGAKGRIVDLGWYYTLCPDCEKSYLDEREKDYKRVQETITKGEA